jgi:hypothetical protein
MNVERLTTVFPTADLPRAVAAWTALLGIEATFVDDNRWAQFDVGSERIALAAEDRVCDVPSVMVKVGDLRAARDEAMAAGIVVGEIECGPHENRCLVEGPDGWPVILYAPCRPARGGSPLRPSAAPRPTTRRHS